jgi:hypothetical protein
MMMQASPIRLIFLGFVLLLIGVLLPFLMVLQILGPSILLSFLAYLSSLGGLVIGLVGITMYSRSEKRGGD